MGKAMENKMPLDYFGDARQVAVERASAEFRAARPVAIHSGGSLGLAFPAEGLTEKQIHFLQAPGRNARLVIPGEKAKPSGSWDEAAAAVHLHPLTLETIEDYTCHLHDGPARGPASYSAVLTAPNQAGLAALALANLSLLLPAVLVADAGAADLQRLPILSVEAQDIFVLARIHSACLTGDLFGSLKCDCGDQLRGTVKAMAEQGGGIVLYLDQEGRGNGIANKIRAYCLQEEGFDTYDADELLGFGQDQRRFDFAAGMLKQLGYNSVRLMTNNPRKTEALREAGLEVVSTHRVLARQTAHNAKYLAAKRDKGGHLLGDMALDGIDLEEVLQGDASQT
jgi:GTP cyclohydrolase II